jgi:spermidine/putrescine transport system permease protein
MKSPRFALAVPAGLLFILFFLVPVAFIAYYSFGYKPFFLTGLTIATDKLSFSNYGDALSGTSLETFKGTLQISILGTFICLLIGFPFAYWLAVRVSPKWRGLLLGLVIVPFWTNFLVRTIGWRILLAPEGPVSGILKAVGIRDAPLAVLDTRFAVQLGVVYNYLPLMILPIYVAFERIDPALREASRDLGANRWRTLVQVSLPLARPGIAAGLLLVFIPLMGDYITATVLGGAKGNMVGQLVASQFQTAQNWALGSAMAVILMIFIGGTVAVIMLVSRSATAVARSRRVLTLDVPEAGR